MGKKRTNLPAGNDVSKPLLPLISGPEMIKTMSLDELSRLACEIRKVIIETVSRTGGHLAPSLGVVELTLALLRAFDAGQDKIIWDVGHQAYAYKILTGRLDRFPSLRTLDGLCGFPRRDESPYDHFGVGHSSTSISAALGMATARDLDQKDYKVVAIIGDGSMTAGLAYEGLNQAGGLGKNLVVILNDNEMSISKNVGALSSFLSRKLSDPWVIRLKKGVENWMRHIPRIGNDLVGYARRSEDSFKSFFTPGMLFEAFKFNYLGPIDGHDLKSLVLVLEQVKQLEGPILVHVLTKKGKGYEPAEVNPSFFHGVGCFEPETGQAKKISPGEMPTYTEVFGRTLCHLAELDEKIVAITAAMPEGTGLTEFSQRFPDRFFDVGICEQHAVTFAAGLATQGFKPVVAIYSTFMQRSYDQIVHDVCIQNLPVSFFLDRGGLVGEDGPTHHGVFDIAYLRHIPNIVIMVPKDELELKAMTALAVSHSGPSAVRYPRGVGIGIEPDAPPAIVEMGKGEYLLDGQDLLIIALGSRVHPCLDAALSLREEGISAAVFNARFVKPLPEDQLLEMARRFSKILIVEEGVLAGGFGSAVLEFLSDQGALFGQKVKRLGVPDQFVEHGPQRALRGRIGIDGEGIKRAVRELAGRL